jgi:hypothetical protein
MATFSSSAGREWLRQKRLFEAVRVQLGVSINIDTRISIDFDTVSALALLLRVSQVSVPADRIGT